MTVLYLYLVVWGVTNWAFSVWGSNCKNSMTYVIFYAFQPDYQPPLLGSIFPWVEIDPDFRFVREQILLSCPRPDAVSHIRQEGDCNPTLESHLSSSTPPCLLLNSSHTDVLGHSFTQPYGWAECSYPYGVSFSRRGKWLLHVQQMPFVRLPFVFTKTWPTSFVQISYKSPNLSEYHGLPNPIVV